MTLRAVVFDLDYTLAVPDRDRSAILAAAAEDVGAPAVSRAAYLDAHRAHHTNETRAPIFEALLDGHDTDVDPVAFAHRYREHISDAIHPVEGARGLLDSLRETYAVGLLTNGPIAAQRHKLDTLGWHDAFDAVVITGELDNGKPHPDAFTEVLSRLDVAADETVYVGDELEADVQGATAAGLDVIQVVYSGGPERSALANGYVDRDRLAVDLPRVLASY